MGTRAVWKVAGTTTLPRLTLFIAMGKARCGAFAEAFAGTVHPIVAYVNPIFSVVGVRQDAQWLCVEAVGRATERLTQAGEERRRRPLVVIIGQRVAELVL